MISFGKPSAIIKNQRKQSLLFHSTLKLKCKNMIILQL